MFLCKTKSSMINPQDGLVGRIPFTKLAQGINILTTGSL